MAPKLAVCEGHFNPMVGSSQINVTSRCVPVHNDRHVGSLDSTFSLLWVWVEKSRYLSIIIHIEFEN